MNLSGQLNRIRKSWNKLTSGALGYVIYGVLGIVFAYALYFFSGVLLHTDLPFVAVVSGSMDHGANANGAPCKQFPAYVQSFDNWWDLCGTYYLDFGISKETF